MLPSTFTLQSVVAWNCQPSGVNLAAARAAVSHKPSVGRNDPCLCSSGRKYKKCCGR